MAYISADSYGRTCDLCGRYQDAKRVRKVGITWICDLHSGYTPRELQDKRRPEKLRIDIAIKDARPLIINETLEKIEGEILTTLCDYAPTAFVDLQTGTWRTGTFGIQSAAWSLIYLCDIVAEGKRPAWMLTRALNKIPVLADYIVTNYASLAVTSTVQAACGIALLKAYALVGAASYATAAGVLVYDLRENQAHSHATHGYDTWEAQRTSSTAIYTAADMLAYDFLTSYKTAIGDTQSYDGVSITNMISKSLAFWDTGAAGTVGFSTATPYDYFNGTTGVWGNSNTTGTISAINYAFAMRGQRAGGRTAFCDSMFDWLMSFTSAAAYQLPANSTNREMDGYDTAYVYKTTLGTYDPTFAPATILNTATAQNGSSLYDLAAMGILSPTYSARKRAAFKDTRETISRPQPRRQDGSSLDGGHITPFLLGVCGLSLQPYSDDAATERVVDMAALAQAALCLRQAPQLFQGARY